jgi:hypothetical protein
MTSSLAVRPEENLSVLEREAYDKWRRGPDQTPLSPLVALKMYELYLLGHSCDDIVKANENKFPLGIIINARLSHEWDRRRTAYLERLYDDAGNVVRQRQIESAFFLADALAVAHKEFGQKFKEYLQTGDPKVLKGLDLKVTSITTYKMVVDALMKVTGQEKPGKDSAPLVQMNISGGTATVTDGKSGATATIGSGSTGQDAFAFLRGLEAVDAEEKMK